MRLRFAPSPTGDLHVGGARTALYNWLLARRHGGVHVLRIEDTDEARSSDAFRRCLLESLEWLGITWDEGPIYQVGWHLPEAYRQQRLAHYRAWGERLVATGLGYWRDDPGQGRALVFRHGGGHVGWTDAVHGMSGRDTSGDPDLVCLKSSGWPTYNFACVVDDIDARISHVLRGDDHIANTPKQIALYRAFGATPPVFAHLPLILTPDGKKMSKDWKKKGLDGAAVEVPTGVLRYRDLGYLAPAVRNFLALLGWSPGDDREVMTPDELVAAFALERVKSQPARWDVEKLQWMNAEYLRVAAPADLLPALRPLVAAAGLAAERLSPELVAALQAKLATLADFPARARFALADDVAWDEKAAGKFLTPAAVPLLDAVDMALRSIEPFAAAAIGAALGPILDAHGGIKKTGQALRVAATGTAVSPELFVTVALVGRERMRQRLAAARARAAANEFPTRFSDSAG